MIPIAAVRNDPNPACTWRSFPITGVTFQEQISAHSATVADFRPADESRKPNGLRFRPAHCPRGAAVAHRGGSYGTPPHRTEARLQIPGAGVLAVLAFRILSRSTAR
jgi:hypothetical protein